MTSISPNEMKLAILQIQPSQLYLSASKIEQVKAWFHPEQPELFQPLPIKRVGKRLFFTDGHTRAFLAYQAGWREIPVVWDEDDLNWSAYEYCVKTAEEQDIWSIVDLENRVLSEQDYQTKWIDWCQAVFKKIHET